MNSINAIFFFIIKIIIITLIFNNKISNAAIVINNNNNNNNGDDSVVPNESLSSSNNLELICPKIMHHIFEQSAPIGDNKSGNFTEYHKGTDNIIECVESCCLLKTKCNVAFIFNHNCYHVKCVNNELCLPKKRPQITEKLQMVLVNPVQPQQDNQQNDNNNDGSSTETSISSGSESEIGSISWIDVLKNSNIEDFLPSSSSSSTGIDSENNISPTFWKKFNKKLRFHELSPMIDTFDNNDAEKRLNQFFIGHRNNNDYDRFNNNDPQYTSIGDGDVDVDNIIEDGNFLSDTTTNTCEIGIIDNTNCGINEECIQILPKTRNGICNCIKGYHRNKLHNCIKNDLDFDETKFVEKILMNNDEPTISETTVSNNNNNRGINTDTNGNSNNNDNIDHNNLDKIEIEKRPLKQLTIRVISKTVQLPEKEVSLAAYTVPDERTSGETYKYLWTLITQPPNGAINGTISDQTKDKVKLTNLSEGLYTFKVTVTGNSSYGETIANVTVLPEKRINRIPQVIITPKQQTLKLPSSQAILDGSTSIDDDKIIKWHWELIQGPIGYQPKLPETSTLQLKDLTPGNYTFKLTVFNLHFYFI